MSPKVAFGGTGGLCGWLRVTKRHTTATPTPASVPSLTRNRPRQAPVSPIGGLGAPDLTAAGAMESGKVALCLAAPVRGADTRPLRAPDARGRPGIDPRTEVAQMLKTRVSRSAADDRRPRRGRLPGGRPGGRRGEGRARRPPGGGQGAADPAPAAGQAPAPDHRGPGPEDPRRAPRQAAEQRREAFATLPEASRRRRSIR